MKFIKRIFSKFHILGELIRFFWENKLWWLLPILFVLLALGLLIIFTESTAVGPFIYTLF